MKFVKGLMKQMSERNDCQNEPECNQSFPRPQADDHETAGNKFDKGNHDASRPQRPDRQKSICEREKILARVLQWSELKYFPGPGHEKNQTEHEAREKNRPTPIAIKDLFCSRHLAGYATNEFGRHSCKPRRPSSRKQPGAQRLCLSR